MKKKKKKYKKNPVGEGLLVVNPSKPRKYKKNPKWLGGKNLFAGMVDRSTPVQLGVMGAGAGLSRYATAKILGAKDTGVKSLAVQGGAGFVGGFAIKNFLKQATLGKFFFMGSLFHAGWRFVSTMLSKNLVAGFEYGDVYREAPAAAAAAGPAAPGTSGLYIDEGETVDEGVEGVGNVAYETPY